MLVFILLVGSFLRFYNLLWGDGFFFHPDENNMARAIAQMTPEKGLNPEFFAYGQLPLYLAYFSAQIFLLISGQVASKSLDFSLQPVPFEMAVFWLRFWSASASVAGMYLVYLIARTLLTKRYALLATLATAATPGLIQAAHFGTTESFLTFFFLLILYLCIRIIQNKSDIHTSNRLFVLLGMVFGLSTGIKLTSIYFVVPLILTLFVHFLYIRPLRQSFLPLYMVLLLALTGTSAIFGYIISSPYNLISYFDFKSSMSYEIGVAQGLDVFYTRQFYETVPYLFQMQHIFPYVLGWPLFVFGSTGLLYILINLIRRIIHHSAAKKAPLYIMSILAISFFSFVIFTSMLYVKWTRFLTPVFPLYSLFFAIMAAWAIP
ncbi:glycosyltransferase family 39 protein, partial [Candidatus Roizmanbacteria bacterium]|nr:glycosyltransferase family 39 protein [Candidatus Roizmanbacteria bacterium]